MEKTIFLFRRKASRSPADFRRHYVQAHAPLGARLTRCLLGYTVNLVETPGGPDAVTEHWLPRAMDLLTPEVAYATQEDFQQVVADDRTLFDGFDLYVVDQETYPVPGEPLAAPFGHATPEAKAIWLYPDAAAAPAPPSGARRVVDNRVRCKLVFAEDGRRAEVGSEFALIRMAWAADLARLGPAVADALVVAEHRFLPAPAWPVDGAGA
jgi:hypothetical protein